MKILIFTNHSYMFWRFRRELTEELLKNNKVILSTPFVGHEEDLKNLGCETVKTDIDRRGVNPLVDYKLVLFYYKLIKKEKPDLVITYSIKPNIYASLVCRMLKIPYCVNVQGLGTAFEEKTLAKIVTFLYKIALKKARVTFFENTENAKLFRDLGIQNKDRQAVLNGAGINLDYFFYCDYPKNDKFRFLYLGRIMKEKGMDELFEAVRLLKKDGYDFVLDLVGFYEDEYEETVNQLVKDGIVVFHGFQSEPRRFYNASDCVVLPSYHEGMSNVLLESAAIGRPIITTDIPGCREAVFENKNGILVEKENVQSLYSAMKKILEMPTSEREEMGKIGNDFMKSCFEKKKVVNDTVKYLDI